MADTSQKPLYREDVQVELDYAVASEGNRIILHPSEPGGQSGTRDGQFEKKKVRIANGRSLIGSLSLDIQGFEIKTQKTKTWSRKQQVVRERLSSIIRKDTTIQFNGKNDR